jgi:hypothetical protein
MLNLGHGALGHPGQNLFGTDYVQTFLRNTYGLYIDIAQISASIEPGAAILQTFE